MCDLRLPPGLQNEFITFGLLPSVALLWFVTNVSGLCIHPEMLDMNQRKETLGNNPKVVNSKLPDIQSKPNETSQPAAQHVHATVEKNCILR
jgi:hypothetical protein